MRTPTVRVLFTGYAPVHFACFRPLYDRLLDHPAVEVYVSGGLRTKENGTASYDAEALYGPFGVPRERVLSVAEIGERDFDVLFAGNTKMITPRSVGARVQIFHGISFRNKSVREDNANADYYFIVGPYMRRAFARTGIIPAGDPRALEIGFLKTDRLLDGTLDRGALLAQMGFGGDRPVVLYAPTGQKNNSLETMGEAVIRRLKATGRYDLIVKPHDHPKRTKVDWFERLAPLEDAHTRITREPDVIPLLFLADLLVTDASSVSSEYALLDRPMVFLDVPKLLASSASQGSMVDLDTWGRRCGDVVLQAADVEEAVAHALAHPERHAAVRQAMAADLFYNAGRASAVAAAWFSETFLVPAGADRQAA